MSTKNKKPLTAAQRKLAIRRWRNWAAEFDAMTLRELGKAPRIPGGTTLWAVVVGNFDKTSEYVQIFHPGPPPIFGSFSNRVN